MAQRQFFGLTYNFYGQPAPLFDLNDLQELAGCYARPWTSRFSHLAISTGSLPVWSARYPSVASRNIVVNTLLGAHLNPFAGGQITSHQGITWRDPVLSSLAPVPAIQPPPVWAVAENVLLDSNNYPTYVLNLSVCGHKPGCAYYDYVGAFGSGTDLSLEVPVDPMPAATTAALMAYIGVPILTSTDSLPLRRPTATITRFNYGLYIRWLSAIWFGSLTGRLNRSRTCNGSTSNLRSQRSIQIKPCLSGTMVPDCPPCRRPIILHSMHFPSLAAPNRRVAGALMSQSVTAVTGLPALIDEATLPAWSQGVANLTGNGQGVVPCLDYNPVPMAAARHLQWRQDGLITAAQEAQLNNDYTAYALTIERHLTAMLVANPIAAGRMPIQPFNAADFGQAGQTAAAVALAQAMFV
uniref:Outer capsid protein VP6 n=1 Tax=Grass carp reovirus TaxID=128987 RepID=Q9IFX7_GCRV|nr:outer capsid protein VP6 [Grass carp reovirus]